MATVFIAKEKLVELEHKYTTYYLYITRLFI